MYARISPFNPHDNPVKLISPLLLLLFQFYKEGNRLIEVKHLAVDLTSSFHKSFPQTSVMVSRKFRAGREVRNKNLLLFFSEETDSEMGRIHIYCYLLSLC